MNRTWPTLTCLALASACGGAPPPSSAEPSGPLELAQELQLADGVTAMETTCDEAAEERCDGTDTNCDGQIDEGCDGASSAAVVLSLAWNDGSDVDLVVEGPVGFEGDDARGDCTDGVDETTSPRLERRVLADAAPGRYVVRAVRRDRCGSEEPTTVSLSASVLGSGGGTFNRTLADGEEGAELVGFELVAR